MQELLRSPIRQGPASTSLMKTELSELVGFRKEGVRIEKSNRFYRSESHLEIRVRSSTNTFQ